MSNENNNTRSGDTLDEERRTALDQIKPDGRLLYFCVECQEFGENWANWINNQLDDALSPQMMSVLRTQGAKPNRHKPIGLHFNETDLVDAPIRQGSHSRAESHRKSYLESFYYYGRVHPSVPLSFEELVPATAKIFEVSYLSNPLEVSDFDGLLTYIERYFHSLEKDPDYRSRRSNHP